MDNFTALYQRLVQIPFRGTGDVQVPPLPSLRQTLTDASLLLPRSYVDGYAAPLLSRLDALIALVASDKLQEGVFEALCGSVYLHHQGTSITPKLNRFLAVTSNLFRSFLSDVKRAKLEIPLSEVLPPLAVFQRDGQMGPYAVTVDETTRLIGSSIAIVSLPSSCADDPLIWAILAHETGGHIVTHSDPGLLQQIAESVPLAIAGAPTVPTAPRDLLSLLWSYWTDEVVADVYGILNIGPAFAFNMAAFFSAATAKGSNAPPKLRMGSTYIPSDPSKQLDPHPPDILRLHIAIGAIEAQVDLSADTRLQYIDLIQDLSDFLATGDQCNLEGQIPVERDKWVAINQTVPLSVMQSIARNCGALVATSKLRSLANRSIQDIETWDDHDEEQSVKVRDAMFRGDLVAFLGDDAQLLAGATMAVLAQPQDYDRVTAALNAGLDESFRQDPIWGLPSSSKTFSGAVGSIVVNRSFWPSHVSGHPRNHFSRAWPQGELSKDT